MTTFPTVERTSDDASGFLDGVDRIVAGLVFRYRPQLVCLVRIRKWFDHRWLGFSGIGRVFFDPPWPKHPGVSLDSCRRGQLTFPPFTPSRVAGELHWERQHGGSYARAPARFLIHRSERQHSSWNLQRRILDITDSALFVWFSSTSAKDGRASMLVYIANDGATIPWFASMNRDVNAWALADVDGLGRVEVQELLQHPPGVHG
jgi:hypothetical protein